MRFGTQVCGEPALGAAREWLVADGRGGYAMGTVSGLRTRRYHGLLVEMTEELALHSELKLEFDLTLVEYHATDVYARVITLKPEGGQWLAGLEFTSISPECHAKVQMFVQLLVAAR